MLLDKRVPIIGDDPRFLQAGYELSLPLKQLDFAKFASTWQNLFIHPERFPRTPLFALLSVPAFLIFGANEDVAIISNLLILALNSYLIWLLAKKLFTKNADLIGLSALITYNLLPGIFGFGRLYMSETLQTFFVLLTSNLLLKYKSSKELKDFISLGLTLGLSWLLRFIMPIYLVIPLLYFGFEQLKLKQKPLNYLKKIAVLLIAFIIPVSTWYFKNFAVYWEFTKFTSSGELASFYSLGNVWSSITILKFWYVIASWVYGWPFLLSVVVLLATYIFFNRRHILQSSTNFKLKKIKSQVFARPETYLLLSFLPALISTTLSLNKTARYFVPVVPFTILLISILLVEIYKKLSWKILIVLPIILYPFLQSLLPLPTLPRTKLNPATNLWKTSTEEYVPYSFVLSNLADIVKSNPEIKIYNAAEQPLFNDAELIWYASQNGITLLNTDEFSRYTDLEQGKIELALTDVIILDSDPEAGQLWSDKYQQIEQFIHQNLDTIILNELIMQDGSTMQILLNLKSDERNV